MLRKLWNSLLSILDNSPLEPDGYDGTVQYIEALEGKFFLSPRNKFIYTVKGGFIYWTPLNDQLRYGICLSIANVLHAVSMFDLLGIKVIDHNAFKLTTNAGSTWLFRITTGHLVGPFIKAGNEEFALEQLKAAKEIIYGGNAHA